jgi:hypothetical protein
VFRELREVALERFCKQVVDEVERRCRHTSKSPHERYVDMYRFLGRETKIAHAFDDPWRSRMIGHLAAIHSHRFLEPRELERFTEPTRAPIEWLARESKD